MCCQPLPARFAFAHRYADRNCEVSRHWRGSHFGIPLWFLHFVSTLAKVAQHAQRFFFASVVSAMQIPERPLSELAESVRVFERGEAALTECWRTWRICLDNSRKNNRHFDRERWYPVPANPGSCAKGEAGT